MFGAEKSVFERRSQLRVKFKKEIFQQFVKGNKNPNSHV
jgi:hypothetical protein